MTVEQLINNLSKFDKKAQVTVVNKELVITSVNRLNLSPYYYKADVNWNVLEELKRKLEEE